MKDKLLKIINHYGLDKQSKYIHSEYFELDEAIIQYEQAKRFMSNVIEFRLTKQHIAEELADIQVMLKQFQYYFDIEDGEIEETMKYKIDRQLDRIEKENK